ncbi:MAG: 3'-5' exonuclease [Acidobacteriota bacterium]
MARRLDAIVVVDLESTCWEGPPPAGQVSDIIEIGVCLLDVDTLERRDRRALLVKPARSEVSPFCTSLTTLRAEDVADAPSLAEVSALLEATYEARDRPFASFGDYDRRQLERCCADQGVRYPFGPTHLNVKTLFAVTHRMSREVGMAGALERLGLPLDGTHHRGVDDAWNVAAILAALLAKSR